MRFHVPNNELDQYMEKMNAEDGKINKGSDEEDEEMTSAKIFDNKIKQKANIS